MQYIAIINHINADGEEQIATCAISAQDARTAHAIAAQTANNGDEIRIYPDTATAAGIARGALMVARRTAINAIKRTGGNPTQHRIEREFAAANARCVGAETADRILYVIRTYSADTQDFFSIAMDALTETALLNLDITEQYHRAYLALNAYIHAQRAATEREISTEYLIDGGGDIVSINTALSQIIRGGDRWTPTDGGTMDADTATRLGVAIRGAMVALSPTQRDIVRRAALGYSQRQIAEQTGRGVATIARNLALIRAKVSEYLHDNAPEFGAMIDSMAVTAATHTANSSEGANKRRTADGAERKAAKNAEYCKAYRARKAAERKAQSGKK